jgi:Domain of unknown function (DUF5615)
MLLRFLIDENFDQRILRGLRLRLRQLDYVVVQQIGMGGLDDRALLEWAANEGRVLITHDVNTITRHAIERVKQERQMPGVIIVPDQLEIGRVIEDLEIISECAAEADLRNQIQYLPL